MYNDDVVISLADQVVQAYHFDEHMKFAGFTLKNIKTGMVENVIAKDLNVA